MDQFEEFICNPAIEKRAVEFVIEIEQQEGRSARDTRGHGRGDVESDGRIIEVKGFSGWGLRTMRLLYFTPPQLREGETNAEYYVYIVENIAQGDPAKFELRVLHGEELKRLFAGAKPHRYYVAVHASKYAVLPKMERGTAAVVKPA